MKKEEEEKSTVREGVPQQITWMYIWGDLETDLKDLFGDDDDDDGGGVLGNALNVREVRGLIQREKCRIFHTTDAPSAYLGICITRNGPNCTKGSNGDDVPATYTFVAKVRASTRAGQRGGRRDFMNDASTRPRQQRKKNAQDTKRVDDIYERMLPSNGTTLRVTKPSGSPHVWGAYGFNFYDTNVRTGLGCYRFEVQAFTDPKWPKDTHEALQNQLRRAGEMLYNETVPATPVSCACVDFCAGSCFAPSCKPCDAKVWNGDETSCLSAGPLGEGLLCSTPGEPCCSPDGEACRLVGHEWCDCSVYHDAVPALFPPLSATRSYENGVCAARTVALHTTVSDVEAHLATTTTVTWSNVKLPRDTNGDMLLTGETSVLVHNDSYYFYFNNWGSCPGVDCCPTDGGCASCCFDSYSNYTPGCEDPKDGSNPYGTSVSLSFYHV